MCKNLSSPGGLLLHGTVGGWHSLQPLNRVRRQRRFTQPMQQKALLSMRRRRLPQRGMHPPGESRGRLGHHHAHCKCQHVSRQRGDHQDQWTALWHHLPPYRHHRSGGRQPPPCLNKDSELTPMCRPTGGDSTISYLSQLMTTRSALILRKA